MSCHLIHALLLGLASAWAGVRAPVDLGQTLSLDQAYRIDLSSIDVAYDLDLAAAELRARARLSFRMRPGQTRALFHFAPRVKDKSAREVIQSLELDGQRLDAHDGHELKAIPIPGARARALEIQRELDPDREHVLVVDWLVPEAFQRLESGWLRTDVDDSVGRGNELLWPTINSPDELARHTITVRVRAEREYLVLGSGTIQQLSDADIPTWVLDTEREVASYTVMLAVIPRDEVEVETFQVGEVPVTMAATVAPKQRQRARRITERVLPRLVQDFGPFPMPSLQILLLDWDGGMEYYGATTSGISALEHELVHMYWGCSGLNRTWRDTWIDEAIATWWSEREDLDPLPPDFTADLIGERTATWPAFDLRAYDLGARIMAEISRQLGGDDAMIRFLSDLHRRRAFVPFTTEEFIADVVAASDSQELGQKLKRWLFSPDVARWLTRGYGYLIEIEGDELRLYSHCELGDLPLGTARRVAAGKDVFETEEQERGTLRRRKSDGALVMDWDWTSHPVLLETTDEAPRVPDQPRLEDPLFNFDWFCTVYREHYAFFDLRGVDWAAATSRARAGLETSSEPAELFDALSDLIAPLEDGHCSVSKEERAVSFGRPDPDPAASRQMGRLHGLIDELYLEGEPVRACGGRLTAARVGGTVGYLRLDGMNGPTDELEEALDRAFEHLAGMSGLIVDLRFNGGGTDTYGFRLTARLIRERTFAAAKFVRSNPVDSELITPVGEFSVEPSDRPGFHGPVVLLVSRHTASAAEVFGMSLIERQPRVTFMGEASSGGFSDILGSELPNGWSFGLSNEVYRTRQGDCFEGSGLPLDVEIPTLRTVDLEASADPALEAAVDLLLQGD